MFMFELDFGFSGREKIDVTLSSFSPTVTTHPKILPEVPKTLNARQPSWPFCVFLASIYLPIYPSIFKPNRPT